MRPLDEYIKSQLDQHIATLEGILETDIMAILSPLTTPLEYVVKNALEKLPERKNSLSIVLETPGGVVEVVERIVNTIRHHYREVTFIVPNQAMSAGTVFVMSGDRILMDYFSCLGPIDPQIVKDDRLVPALSYLSQFERLNEKARAGQLTTAEYALLNQLDIGELHQFEQARELSIELLKKWLSAYQFKDWERTETRGLEVTPEMKETRAREIADALSDNEKWHSHGRGINKNTLINELNLRISDFSEIDGLKPEVLAYSELLRDYVFSQNLRMFVHTKAFF